MWLPPYLVQEAASSPIAKRRSDMLRESGVNHLELYGPVPDKFSSLKLALI
jgi:hypothetical protein